MSALRTHVRFLGGERYVGATEHLDYPHTCGAGVLEALTRMLFDAGFHSRSEIARRWGAIAVVVEGKESLQITCGFRKPEWLLVFAHPGLFGERPPEDTPFVRQVMTLINKQLHRMPGIGEIAWHAEEDWTHDASAGAKKPF